MERCRSEMAIPQARSKRQVNPPHPTLQAAGRRLIASGVSARSAEKSFVRTFRGVRTKTDTGRRGEKPQALERTLVKELGKMTP